MRKSLLLLPFLLTGCAGTYSSFEYKPDVYVERNLKKPQPAYVQETRPMATPTEQATLPRVESPTERTTRDGGLWQPVGGRKLWVLSVGIGQYRNPAIPGLPFAKADASRLRDWFLQRDTQTVTRENIHVLLDEQATRENLLAQIDWLRKQAMPEDAVVFYFAGHGAPELAPDGKSVDAKYLVLFDTDPSQLFATGFSLDDLTRKLEAVKAKVQVVVLEACYAGPVGQDILSKTPTADLEIRPRFVQEMGARGDE
jgi:hypothetical protein